MHGIETSTFILIKKLTAQWNLELALCCFIVSVPKCKSLLTTTYSHPSFGFLI